MRVFKGTGVALSLALCIVPIDWAGGAPPTKSGEAAKASPKDALQVKAVTLLIGHRVFPDFHEERTVGLQKAFQVGDTDFYARIVRFVPDFAMETKTRRIVSRSPEPRNPAFEIVVHQGTQPQDTTWAFFNMPPHFGRTSYLSFQVARIDFEGRSPLVAPDSLLQRGAKP